MFVPFFIRHNYEHRPVMTWELAGLILAVNLFSLAVPGWLIELKRSEMLGLLCYNPESHQYFQILSYFLLDSNLLLLVLNLAALLLFGSAVEARLGWWRFALVYLLSAAATPLVHGLLQPHFPIAGSAGAVFGIVGAAVLIFGFSETEGFAFFVWPVPPKAAFGVRAVPTILVLAAYAIAVIVWRILTPTKGSDMISLWGLGAGFLTGALSTAAMLGPLIPILHPQQMDPSRALDEEKQRRREKLASELAAGGLFAGEPETHREAANLGQAPAPAEAPAKAEETPGARRDAESAMATLTKMVVMKNATELAALYKDFIGNFPDEALRTAPQFDMAKLLGDSFHYALALDAYEKLIRKRPTTPLALRALFEAGKMCLHVPGKEQQGIACLDRFLDSKPSRRDLIEAQRTKQELQEAMAMAEAERLTRPEEAQVEAGVSSPDSPREPRTGAKTGPGQPGEAPYENIFEELEGMAFQGPKGSAASAGPSAAEQTATPPLFEPARKAPEESDDSALSRMAALDLGPTLIEETTASEDRRLFGEIEGAKHPQPAGAPSGKEHAGVPKEGEDHAGPPKQAAEQAAIPVDPIILASLDEEGDAEAEDDTGLDLDEPSASQIPLGAAAPPAAGQTGAAEGLELAEGLLYSLIIEPKTALRLGALIPVLSQRLSQGRTEIEDLLRRRKGIVLRDLELNEALEIRDRCRSAGQQLLVVGQTPDLDYSQVVEAEEVRIGHAKLEWLAGPSWISAKSEDALLLSAGKVRVRPGSSRSRLAASAYFRSSRLHVRIWESTFRYRDDPALAHMPPPKAFATVCLSLAEACAKAMLTSGFRRLFEPLSSGGPLEFFSEAEFDDYNTWNLLAAFGRRPREME